MKIPEYASVILVSMEGEIILQLRDNNPAIADPNCLSLFAGRIEDGESRQSAARRELLEETELDIPHLKYLFTFKTNTEHHGRLAQSHVFIATNVDKRDITVHEGQGYRTITDAGDLDFFLYAQISKDILMTYFEKYHKFYMV